VLQGSAVVEVSLPKVDAEALQEDDHDLEVHTTIPPLQERIWPVI